MRTERRRMEPFHPVHVNTIDALSPQSFLLCSGPLSPQSWLLSPHPRRFALPRIDGDTAMFETIVTTLQIACVLILVVGTPLYAVLKLKWRAEAAEKAARSQELRNASLSAELETLTEGLPLLER